MLKISLLLLLAAFLAIGLIPEEPVRLNPGPRYGHELVYDETRAEVVLYGGFHSDGIPLGDTWSWNGQTWGRKAVTGPSARKWPAMAYVSKRGHSLLFGGRRGSGQNSASLSDTWIWNGRSWSAQDVKGPSARDHHRMVYDRNRDRVILFGGWDGEQLLGDTWEWDGRQWTQVSQIGPSARAPFGLAYDERNMQVVLFGGKTLEEFFDDTWIWDGSRWNQIEVSGPSPRAFHAMTYHSGQGQVLLFSGRSGDAMLADTWSWNGGSWKLLDSDGPLRRGVYSLVYDRLHNQALFYGSGIREAGQWILDDDIWAWKEGRWQAR